MHINISINKSKKSRGRPKKVKVVQSSFALGGNSIDKLFSSNSRMEEIKIITPVVISKNENPNQFYKNNENLTKRKCLRCNKIFDNWGISNRLLQRL